MTGLLTPSTEAARSCQVTARAIRFYEELGLIRTQRDSLNRRCFDSINRKKLAFVALLRRGGVSIFDIGKALDLLDAKETALEFEAFVDALIQKRSFDLNAQMRALEGTSEVTALVTHYAAPSMSALPIDETDRHAVNSHALVHGTPRECAQP